MSTTTYSFPRSIPPKRIALRKLQQEIADPNSGFDGLKDLGGGRFGLLKHELGFMEMIHHVAIYVAKPGIFQKDRLELITTKEFETSEEAAGAFESLR